MSETRVPLTPWLAVKIGIWALASTAFVHGWRVVERDVFAVPVSLFACVVAPLVGWFMLVFRSEMKIEPRLFHVTTVPTLIWSVLLVTYVAMLVHDPMAFAK